MIKIHLSIEDHRHASAVTEMMADLLDRDANFNGETFRIILDVCTFVDDDFDANRAARVLALVHATIATSPPKKSALESIQITIRLTNRILEKAEALCEFVSEETGRIVTRSEVLREATLIGLKSLEAKRDREKT